MEYGFLVVNGVTSLHSNRIPYRAFQVPIKSFQTTTARLIQGDKKALTIPQNTLVGYIEIEKSGFFEKLKAQRELEPGMAQHAM